MAKTQLTRDIEKALHYWNPTSYGGYRVDSFRQGFDALEVPVECGTVKSGLVDFVRVQECFTSEKKRLLQAGFSYSGKHLCAADGKRSRMPQGYF